jgi:hypothetical protein
METRPLFGMTLGWMGSAPKFWHHLFMPSPDKKLRASAMPSPMMLGFVILTLQRIYPSNTYKNSPPYWDTPLNSSYMTISQILLLGSSLATESTRVPRPTMGILRGLFALIWTMSCGRFGPPLSAKSSHGSSSKTEFGLVTDSHDADGQMVAFAP